MTPPTEPWTDREAVRLYLSAHLRGALEAEAEATGATVRDLIRLALTERNERMLTAAPLWIDPQCMGGAVCIASTRIDTATIANLAWQHGVHEVRNCFPDLTDYQIGCAIWWEWQFDERKRQQWANRWRSDRDQSPSEALDRAPTQADEANR